MVWCSCCREGEAGEMLRYVPVQAAIIGCSALRNIYTCDAECFLRDFEGRIGGLRDAKGARDEHEFVVGACWASVLYRYGT